MAGKRAPRRMAVAVCAALLSGLYVLAGAFCPASAFARGETFDTGKTYAQMAEEMAIGWNLGNSLDATDGVGLGCEVAWGNPRTTQKTFLDVKEMGFGAVRIPVSWSKHADDRGEIDGAWMARVKEVVDDALGSGLCVILNSHHDTGYYDIAGCLEDENVYAANVRKMEALWTNIAETFREYDERLLFETLNEPRVVGSKKEWQGGMREEREVVYTLNEAIVKAIRATGGNNRFRYLLLPSYGATARKDILREMRLPDDDRLVLSVHAYEPYAFAYDAEQSGRFGYFAKKQVEKLFSDLGQISEEKGVPVFLGECGAINKDDPDRRVEWAETFVAAAKRNGILCAVWDNGQTGVGHECFGLYDRNAGAWAFPEVAEAMVRAARLPAGAQPVYALDIILPAAGILLLAAVVLIVLTVCRKCRNK